MGRHHALESWRSIIARTRVCSLHGLFLRIVPHSSQTLHHLAWCQARWPGHGGKRFVLSATPWVALAQPHAVRLLTFNVNIHNTAYESFSTYVRSMHPDIVVLQEANKAWLAKTVLAEFPFGQAGPGRYVIASRFPLVKNSAPASSRNRGHRLVAQRVLVSLGDGGDGMAAVAIYNVHPATPRLRNGIQRQAEDYAALSMQVADEPTNRVVIASGDFNAVPGFPVFVRFRAVTGLVLLASDTLATPTRFPKEYGLPIWLGAATDHVTAKGSVALVNRTVGPALGSDHLPVVADLVIDTAR